MGELKYKGKSYRTVDDLLSENKGPAIAVVEKRLRRGYSIGEAVDTPVGGPVGWMFQGKFYRTCADLLVAHGAEGVCPATVSRRLKTGSNLEEAVTKPVRRRVKRTWAFEGEEYAGLGELLAAHGAEGVTVQCLRHRLKSGIPLKKALRTPPHGIGKKVWRLSGIDYPTLDAAITAEGAEGISASIVRARLQQGLDLATAVATPPKETPRTVRLEVDGRTYTSLKQLAKDYGLSYQTAYRRWSRGWPDHEVAHGRERKAEAPERRPTRPHEIAHQGQKYASISALCREYGIDYHTFRARMRYGWSIDEALSVPVGTRRSHPIGANQVDAPATDTGGHSGKQPLSIAGDKFVSIAAAARAYGLEPYVLRSRLKKSGYTPEQAVGLEPLPENRRFRGSNQRLDVGGQIFRSVPEAARRYNVPLTTVHSRRSAGASWEQALGIEPIYGSNTIEFLGRKFATLKTLAEAHGLTGELVSSRLTNGWTLEQALELEARPAMAQNQGIYGDHLFARFPELRETPSTIYFVEIEHRESGTAFQKVGITTGSLERRFSSAAYTFSALATLKLPLYEAWTLEQMILDDYEKYRFVWPEHDFEGRTECFQLPDDKQREIARLLRDF